MWVLGNARTALTGRRALGKREETEEWLSLENKQTFVSEREREREREDCLTACLPSAAHDGERDSFRNCTNTSKNLLSSEAVRRSDQDSE